MPIAIQADSDDVPAVAGVAGLFTGLDEKQKLAGIEDGAAAKSTTLVIQPMAESDAR